MKQTPVLGLLLFANYLTNIAGMFPKGKDACELCSCKWFSDICLVNCEDLHLSKLPQNIPKGAIELKLFGNEISDIQKGAFSHISNLDRLDISTNKLEEVTDGVFFPLERLHELYLRDNRITRIDKGSFKSLRRLTSLDLQGNRIKHLDGEIFKNVSSLIILNLSDNRLEWLSENLFTNNRKLTGLQLQGNKICNIAQNVFAPFEGLSRLDLSRNKIEEIPAELVLRMRNESLLVLSSNKMHNLPENGFGNAYYLSDLRLSQNKFQTIKRNNFGDLRRVQALYLSYNDLSSLPGDLFSNVQITFTLDLSNNRLKTLPYGLFDTNNATHEMTILFLHRNQISHLPKYAFAGLRNLENLCLFYNKLQVLADDTFAGIVVETTYLFGNNLSSLSNASFINGKTSEIFIDCDNIHDFQLNVKIVCVTPRFVPKLSLEKSAQAVLEREGFTCHDEGKPNIKRTIEVSCSPCHRGTYGTVGECFPCFRGGFYQDKVGISRYNDQEVCKKCDNGTFVRDGRGQSIGDCKVCPDGTNKQLHAGFRGCFCLERYARTDRFGPCFLCPEKGVDCNGKDYMSLKPGFYWNWEFPGANLSRYNSFVNNLNNESSIFDENTEYIGEIPRTFKCPRRESCTNNNDGAEANCSEGYKGWLCSKCDTNFYSVLNNCLPCPGKEWLFIEVSLILSFLVILWAILFRFYKKETRRSESDRSLIDIVMSRGKIVLGFYQVVGEFFASLHEVNWAKTLTFIGSLISFLELNVLRLFVRPQCLHEKLKINPKIEFVIGLSFPVTIISLLIFIYWALIARQTCRVRMRTSFQLSDTYKKKLKSNILTIVIITLFLTYPPICTIIFQVYPRACDSFCLDSANFTCKILLRSDYDIECSTLKVFQVFAYIATLGYVVAYPVVLIILLRRKFKLLKLQATPCKWHSLKSGSLQSLVDDSAHGVTYPIWMDFLCENYKPKYWYWEIVELSRKVTQTVLITLLGWEDKLTVLITIGISVLFLTLHARCLPMKNKFEQRLQMFSLVAILVNVLVAAMEVPEEYGDAMSICLIVLNIVVVAIIAAEAVFGLLIRLIHLKIHQHFYRWGIRLTRRVFNAFKRSDHHR